MANERKSADAALNDSKNTLLDGRKTHSRLVQQIPNAITALALCSGLASVRFSIENEFEFALLAIVVAAVLDGLDGRLARRLHASSQFGAEFDSLADFLSFGVAPIVLLFFWGEALMTGPFSLCLMAFALASAARLARFNAQSNSAAAAWQKAYFTGMPTPAAALTVLLPISLASPTPATVQIAGLHAALIAFLMVSTIPTFSGKKWACQVPKRTMIALFLAVAGLVAAVVLYPSEFLVVLTVLYLASIPISWISFRHDEKIHDEIDVETARVVE
ncbi:CDP-diacylglycerol--serine O-phosphatidyltransferase [Mesorhizobium sp.]|uniref:CDP-diacylglycerol--serine O-phosphatidyltransferase n=2 Tax=Mesorhizobium sp. TaxID=1871066 RepID=UPI000FE40495|nr:CDP-diacylglycerol--serine O-phosphatidyltransferase [Mesorhizobium sp.]RWB96424.1 MAG: CDP-diacylglycerol--serine O-phosphatidyltransferase [Mesorhizobium sp.]RWP62601.1 MAG: CDP-diacylglycerol--serine O-phosphatidyltransferase [Mesorhizobium sp.]RWQ14173.1 MAG: CDP-diacylglycerol--serine O-phosphatidyltransferase [Mesorhizobium sp.]